ncbi:Thioredoxin [Limosilactobacillus gastricus PS3]|uniref:Thioredoxin n=1 Tax=Limosilactobacillus gastricus PS3 TaxID=1144300 RepID=H4GI90_9LACO|nr:thioredoxin [Limosilactobacillus gastricus]EHS87311.1 Thioredoxin [Limosilactobacillus gastricus PS3]
MAINVSPVNFEQALEGPITLVDFWADWCGPCKLMAPVLDELEAHYQDRVKFVRYDVEQDNSIPQRYKVMSMPSLVLFRDGVVKEKVTGIYNYQQLSHYLDRKLAE